MHIPCLYYYYYIHICSWKKFICTWNILLLWCK